MMTNQQASNKLYRFAPTKRHLVVQTHAGEALNQDTKSPANLGVDQHARWR